MQRSFLRYQIAGWQIIPLAPGMCARQLLPQGSAPMRSCSLMQTSTSLQAVTAFGVPARPLSWVPGGCASPGLSPPVLRCMLPYALHWITAGFENMWGPSMAPGMGGQRGVPPQPSAVPDPRFSDDSATLLDFPDWDGPGWWPWLCDAACSRMLLS